MRNIQSVLPVSHQIFPDHEQSVPTINSHALHRFLGLHESHSSWIGYRIKQLFLVENRDVLVFRKTPTGKAILDAYLIPDAVIRILQYERATALAYGNTREYRAQTGKNVIDGKIFIARKKQKQIRATHCDAALEYLDTLIHGPADDSHTDGTDLQSADLGCSLQGQPAGLRGDQTFSEIPACGPQTQMELAEMRELPKASVEASVPSQSLVQVTERSIGGRMQPTVDARELHAFLGVGKVFAAWIQDRIKQFEFVENQDFVCFPISESKDQPVGRGGHNRLDYRFTLDMAKELSMVERTPKGKEARQYFIECERLRFAPPPTLEQPNAEIAQRAQSMIPILQLHREYLQTFREMGLDPRDATHAALKTMEHQGFPVRNLLQFGLPSSL